MAVPHHDERDHAFASNLALTSFLSFNLEKGVDVQQTAWTEDGVLVNSDRFDGLSVDEAKTQITSWLQDEGISGNEKSTTS